jgi:hypothetical protein
MIYVKGISSLTGKVNVSWGADCRLARQPPPPPPMNSEYVHKNPTLDPARFVCFSFNQLVTVSAPNSDSLHGTLAFI